MKDQKKFSYKEKDDREKIISLVLNLVATDKPISISLLQSKTKLAETTCRLIFSLLEKRSLIKDTISAKSVASQIITSYGINGFRATLILELADALVSPSCEIKESSTLNSEDILEKLSEYRQIILDIDELEKEIIRNKKEITALQEKNQINSNKIKTLNKQLPDEFKVSSTN